MNNKKFLIVLKFVISFSLLAYIINKTDWDRAYQDISNANYYLIVTAFLLNIFERVELTFKWNLLIRARGIVVSFGRLFLINAIGTFWGFFLPSSLGTDVVRGYYLVKNNSEKLVSISSIFVDRFLGLLSLTIIASVAITLSSHTISGIDLKIVLYLISAGMLAAFYLLQNERSSKWFTSLLTRIRFKKVVTPVIKLHQSILEYKNHKEVLWYSFTINFIVQLTRIMIYYFIAIAFGISIPFFYFVLFIPVIMIVLLIPISIGGLGVREGTFIAFFASVGVPVQDAVVITFTNTIINTTNTMLGGLVYLFYNNSPKETEPLLNNTK